MSSANVQSFAACQRLESVQEPEYRIHDTERRMGPEYTAHPSRRPRNRGGIDLGETSPSCARPTGGFALYGSKYL